MAHFLSFYVLAPLMFCRTVCCSLCRTVSIKVLLFRAPL
uniref:Uncharacterized protein n=1 Tax=Rhizophora mucronata TaxID=61149 RepID=A0A2P2QHR5_RHIMU